MLKLSRVESQNWPTEHTSQLKLSFCFADILNSWIWSVLLQPHLLHCFHIHVIAFLPPSKLSLLSLGPKEAFKRMMVRIMCFVAK